MRCGWQRRSTGHGRSLEHMLGEIKESFWKAMHGSPMIPTEIQAFIKQYRARGDRATPCKDVAGCSGSGTAEGNVFSNWIWRGMVGLDGHCYDSQASKAPVAQLRP